MKYFYWIVTEVDCFTVFLHNTTDPDEMQTESPVGIYFNFFLIVSKPIRYYVINCIMLIIFTIYLFIWKGSTIFSACEYIFTHYYIGKLYLFKNWSNENFNIFS